ncbi:hypothetical protein [Duganella sp. HH105]|uniref:hypothetical protein n=1 Tax=Duganella sp. HH105 TaxID=1781067 RepID=UPI00114CA928|nr:hypothetical protein [Duganella sp. HH105]
MRISIGRFFVFLHGFFRRGTTRFNDAENKILAHLLAALPPVECEILRKQLLSLRLVQRPQPGRISIAYFRAPEDLEPLPYPGYEYCLATVSYKSANKTKTTAIVLHDGRLMTFERNVPRELNEIESLGKVVLHPKKFTTVTDEIDTEEHGR